MTATIIVLGDINTDLLMPVPRYPEIGEETMSRELVTRTGGSAANTSIALAHLGLTVRLIGRVGADAWGDQAVGTLQRNGVDTSAVQRDEKHPTGLTFVPALADGQHSMFCYRGANDYTDPGCIDDGMFAGGRLFHLSGYALGNAPQREAAVRAVELARRNGLAISLDTALEPALVYTDEMRGLLPQLELCVLGLDEAYALTGTREPEPAVASLLRSGVRLVGLKLGEGGCLLARAGAKCRMPAFRLNTVDTTGAGDAFSAGLILSWLFGLSLPASALLASALGGLATTVWGGGAALPGRREVIQLLKQEADSPEHGAWAVEALAVVRP